MFFALDGGAASRHSAGSRVSGDQNDQLRISRPLCIKASLVPAVKMAGRYCMLRHAMIRYDRPANLTAFEAISEAQKLAFAPIAFQASVALKRLGILGAVEAAKDDGAAAAEIAALPRRCPCTACACCSTWASSIGLVWQRADRYVLDKVGHFLLNDAMTRVNLDFVADVCYDAMSSLQDSVEQTRAEGPRALRRLADAVRGPPATAGAESERAGSRSITFTRRTHLPQRCEHVFATKPRHLLDIGGNTGLWAMACVEHDPHVEVTIVDLPEQARLTERAPRAGQHAARIRVTAVDLLDADGRAARRAPTRSG